MHQVPVFLLFLFLFFLLLSFGLFLCCVPFFACCYFFFLSFHFRSLFFFFHLLFMTLLFFLFTFLLLKNAFFNPFCRRPYFHFCRGLSVRAYSHAARQSGARHTNAHARSQPHLSCRRERGRDLVFTAKKQSSVHVSKKGKSFL